MRSLMIFSVILASADFITIKDTEDTKTESIVTVPTVKCPEIPPEKGEQQPSEEEACSRFCKSLKQTFQDGQCIHGICNCKLDIGDIVRSVRGKDPDKAEKAEISNGENRAETKEGKGSAGEVTWKGRHGVKCKNLIRFGNQKGTENHKGCGVHCRLLDPVYKDGRCIEGTCRCSMHIINATTVKEKEGEEEEIIKSIAERTQEDGSGCHPGRRPCGQANPRDSSELGPIPRKIFSQISENTIHRQPMKCDLDSKSASDNKCRADCEAFSKDHKEGRCIDGICRCGYAVFENPDSGALEENASGNVKKVQVRRKKNRQRHRGAKSKESE